MKRLIGSLLLLFVAPLLQADDDDTFLLRVAPAHLQAVLEKFDLEVEDSFPQQNLYEVEREDDDDNESNSAFILRVRRDPRVLGFEINQEVEAPEVTPGSPIQPGTVPAQQALQNRSMVNFYGTSALAGFVTQPAGAIIRLPEARTRATGAGVIAVIDTGIDPNHTLLRGALVPGYDFTRNMPGASELDDLDPSTIGVITQEAGAFLEQLRPTLVSQYATAIVTQEAGAFLEGSRPPSGFGHGTMVAGLIRLVAPTARIMPIKAFTALGTASLFDLTRAVYYAADNGARVINMSFTIEQTSDEFTRAINYAASRGVISVGAAGNSGRQTIVFPAGFHNVLGIASTSNANQRSSFSNFGAALVSLAAPGEGLITAYPGGGYASVWGTSFSTPLVAGTVALLQHIRPNTSYAQAEQSLHQAAPAGPDLGAGRLDVNSALVFRMAQP